MGSDQASTTCWNRPLRTIGDWFPAFGTPSSSRLNSRPVAVPVLVVLALAVGVAVVPAIGAGVGPGAGPSGSAEVGAELGAEGDIALSDGAGVGSGGDPGTATTTSIQATTPAVDAAGGSSTHVGTVDLSTPTTSGSASAVVTVVESLSGESIVFLGAYSRFGDGSPLEHPIRSEIDALASRVPGVQFTEAVSSADASESTVRYHTRVLEREGYVQTATVWGTQRLFPAETDASHFEGLAAFRDDSRSAVLRAIDRNEPATVTTLAEDVDRAPSTVSHHLSRLESADLIDRERVGQSVDVSLAPGVRELLAVEADQGGAGVDSTALELVGD